MTAERGADDVRRTPRHDQYTRAGSTRSAVRQTRCQKQSTALVSLDRTQTFLIARVFHPLYGRELQLIDQYLAWGEDRVCFRDDGDELRYLPTAWTSMAPPDPSCGRRPVARISASKTCCGWRRSLPSKRRRSDHDRRRAGVDLCKRNCVAHVK